MKLLCSNLLPIQSSSYVLLCVSILDSSKRSSLMYVVLATVMTQVLEYKVFDNKKNKCKTAIFFRIMDASKQSLFHFT